MAQCTVSRMRAIILSGLLGLANAIAKDPVCSEPAFQGGRKVCMGYFPRFTWTPEQGCHSVVYGGCGAEANLFVTEQECRARCDYNPLLRGSRGPRPRSQGSNIVFPQDKQEDMCSLPPVLPGPFGCLAMVSKWTFSAAEGRCVPYSYGGCRGTANLFATEAECKAKCPEKDVDEPNAEVCSLQMDRGQCRGRKPAFGYNKETGRCETFLWGGCGGNGNNFPSIEQCVAVCGGGEPQRRLECSQVSCNLKAQQIYRAKGCSPVTRPGECCPSSWDCSFWKTRKANSSMCFYSSASDPAGQFYPPGSRIPTVTGSNDCNQACTCTLNRDGRAEIMCASVDCWWGKGEGSVCRDQYEHLNQCCASGKVCDSQLFALPTCRLDGKTFYKGQKMYPAEDSCVECLCQEGWEGDLSSSMCRRVDCGLQLAGDKLLRGCVPVHQQNVCCPTDWVCPQQTLPRPINPRILVALDYESGESSESLESSESDESTESGESEDDPCNMEREVGPCKAAVPSWFYNSQSAACEAFIFGGCRGNANNFPTAESCQATCSSSSSNIAVTLPQPMAPGGPGGFLGGSGGLLGGHAPVPVDREVKMVAGHGKMLLTRVPTITGAECGEAKLLGVLRASRQVVAGTNFRLTLRVGVKTGAECDGGEEQTCSGVVFHRPLGCDESKYATCLEIIQEEDIRCASSSLVAAVPIAAEPVEGLEIARSLAVELTKNDPCLEDKIVGRCRAILPRFYFDRESRSCTSFNYGGCKGNGNNFESLEECQETCATHLTSSSPQTTARSQAPASPCSLPMKAGPCRALRSKHFFNAASGNCEEFLYSGCRGNANNFPSLEQCQAKCLRGPEVTSCIHAEGNTSYAVGDVMRLPSGSRHSGCRSCVCSSPPFLTCTDTVCPLRLFTRPAGGVNCVMQKDALGCCDAGYKCDSVRRPAPPSLGGGMPGGYRREGLTGETKLLAARATKGLLTGVSGVTGQCDHLTLLEVIEVHRQIVAGTNFRLKLRLRTKLAPDCRREQVRECSGVVVFRPLPHACSQQDGCLQLTRPEEIMCV